MKGKLLPLLMRPAYCGEHLMPDAQSRDGVFAERINQVELVPSYRSAIAYISMSEHMHLTRRAALQSVLEAKS